MTHQEKVVSVAKELADVVKVIVDDGFQITDLSQVIEAGLETKQCWNLLSKIEAAGDADIKKVFAAHLGVALSKQLVDLFAPLPEGEITV